MGIQDETQASGLADHIAQEMLHLGPDFALSVSTVLKVSLSKLIGQNERVVRQGIGYISSRTEKRTNGDRQCRVSRLRTFDNKPFITAELKQGLAGKGVQVSDFELAGKLVITKVRVAGIHTHEANDLGFEADLAPQLVEGAVVLDDAKPAQHALQLVIACKAKMVPPQTPHFAHAAFVTCTIEQSFEQQGPVVARDQTRKRIAVVYPVGSKVST